MSLHLRLPFSCLLLACAWCYCLVVASPCLACCFLLGSLERCLCFWFALIFSAKTCWHRQKKEVSKSESLRSVYFRELFFGTVGELFFTHRAGANVTCLAKKSPKFFRIAEWNPNLGSSMRVNLLNSCPPAVVGRWGYGGCVVMAISSLQLFDGESSWCLLENSLFPPSRCRSYPYQEDITDNNQHQHWK